MHTCPCMSVCVCVSVVSVGCPAAKCALSRGASVQHGRGHSAVCVCVCGEQHIPSGSAENGRGHPSSLTKTHLFSLPSFPIFSLFPLSCLCSSPLLSFHYPLSRLSSFSPLLSPFRSLLLSLRTLPPSSSRINKPMMRGKWSSGVEMRRP